MCSGDGNVGTYMDGIWELEDGERLMGYDGEDFRKKWRGRGMVEEIREI